MPPWAQFVVSLTAFLGAVGLLWAKVIAPLIRLAAKSEDLEQRLKHIERRLKDINGKEVEE